MWLTAALLLDDTDAEFKVEARKSISSLSMSLSISASRSSRTSSWSSSLIIVMRG